MGCKFLAASAAIALSLAACAGDEGGTDPDDGGPAESAPLPEGDDDWQQVVDAATDEGQVVVYTALNPETISRLEAAWAEDYPDIGLEVLRGTSGELLARIEQERETGADGADVWITTELGWFNDRAAEGELLELSGPNREEWPDEFVESDGFAPVLSVEPFGIIYNTTLIDEAPQDYSDLSDPQYEGLITVSDVVATIVTDYYRWIEETRGEEVIEGMAAQNPSVMTGSVPIAQAVASGEAAATPYGFPSSVKGLQDQGAPIEFVLPDPALGVPYIGGSLGWSQRPNAAQVFLDWAMSSNAQEPWAANEWSASPLGVETGLDITTIEPSDPGALDADTIDELNTRYAELFR